ncbi:MAG TPA: rhomboid family intramembrane serine protease [Peptococcaceae bacterium]|nr:rhomboid family intramembrane serine protease [Peptococcaceae bacterium]
MNYIYKKEFRDYYVTYTLIFINLVIFILMTIAGGTTNYMVLILFGAKVNPLIEAGQYWRLFTCIFIHIGFTHLLFNTYALIALGKFTEYLFGHKKYLFVYIFCGLCGSLFSYFFSPSISAGASGAIFGLLGSLVGYGWRNAFLWQSGLITNLLIVLGINLFLGFVFPGIDNYAHLGGLLGGLLLGFGSNLIKINRQNFH